MNWAMRLSRGDSICIFRARRDRGGDCDLIVWAVLHPKESALAWALVNAVAVLIILPELAHRLVR